MKSHLNTPEDVKKVRKQMLAQQGGVCGLTGIPLDPSDAVLDHSHSTQKVRATLDRQMNVFLGKIENAYRRYVSYWCPVPLPRLLRLTANYLEQDFSQNPYHPAWIKRCKTDFAKLNTAGMEHVLKSFGLQPQSNATKRKAVFERLLKAGVVTFDEVQEEIKHAALLNPKGPE